MTALGSATTSDQRPDISAETAIGPVSLTVSDLDRARQFYEQAIGLRARERDDGTLALAGSDERVLVSLHGDRSAPARDPGLTGLFHLAILVPSRAELASALRRLVAIGWPLDGASDHLVSEALYLSDPDGNGLELYGDRPRERWPRDGDALRMATLPLDLSDLLGGLKQFSGDPASAPAQTRVGHVHLQVADLRAAEEFYCGVLGFEVMVRSYPGALFVSAGGYHHHIGLNTWHSLGASPPPTGSVGLRWFAIELPDAPELQVVLGRVAAAGITVQRTGSGALVCDPSGNGVLLKTP